MARSHSLYVLALEDSGIDLNRIFREEPNALVKDNTTNLMVIGPQPGLREAFRIAEVMQLQANEAVHQGAGPGTNNNRWRAGCSFGFLMKVIRGR